MVNLPPSLVPSLIDSLMQDLAWAVKHCDEAAERESFRFDTLLVLAHVEHGAAGGASSSGADDAAAGGGGGGKKKKRKQAAQEAAARALEGIVFARPEEEVLAAAAEWSTMLSAPGRSGQLLLALTPDAIRAAIPALQVTMSEE